jgi:archaellum component FlaF (FlaF/FlaG flagellin family)
MGASTSVVIIVLFVGFLAVAISANSSVIYYQTLVKKSQHDQDTMKKVKMQTDIIITNITLTNSNPSYLNITALNSGKRTLNASLLEIFVNGIYYPSYNLSPAGNYTWAPQKNMNISLYPMNYANTTGGRIKVVTENGISAYRLSP